MRFTVNDYTSPDYASPDAAAAAAAYYIGRKVEYDWRGEGFVSKGDVVKPVARPSVPAPVFFDEDFGDDGDNW